MKIGLCSLGLALVLGVVLGILQARYKGGLLDNVCTGYTIFINAVTHLVSYTEITTREHPHNRLNPCLHCEVLVLARQFGKFYGYT